MQETNTPLVSIVMAAYNEELYIGEAIQSILNQTYSNFEFIIINDGSTDQTEAIVQSFKDNRIKYIKNDFNLKLIESLNKGLRVSKGKYIARMDSDDICLPFRLEKQVAYMEANPEIGISGAQLTIFGNSIGEMRYPLAHEDIKLQLFITSPFGNNVVIFRKNILEENNIFFPKGYLHAEDYKCWTNWIKHTKTSNLNEHLMNYRSHSNSVSTKHKKEQRKTRNRIRQEYVLETFSLQNNIQVACNSVDAISLRRILAIKQILKINQEKMIFNQENLKKTLAKLWYLDSLENIEDQFFVFLKYPLIFLLERDNLFNSWLNTIKHYIKFKFSSK